MFVEQAYQPEPVGESEAKRGTSDATYGYYTMGKLMIMKLREDYKAKMGQKYSLKDFHDNFIKLGPLPLPLIRKAMLGRSAIRSRAVREKTERKKIAGSHFVSGGSFVGTQGRRWSDKLIDLWTCEVAAS